MSTNSNDGISPTVGVIVMVAITVAIGIVIGTVALDLGGNTEESVQAGVDIQQQGDGYYRIQWQTAGNAEELQVLVNGSEVDNATLSNPGDSVTIGVSEGDTISVSGSNGDSTTQVSSTTASDGNFSSPTVSSTPETTLSNSTSSDTSGSGETVTVNYEVTNNTDSETDMTITLDVSDGVGEVDSVTETAVSSDETRSGTLEWDVPSDQENGEYTLTVSGGGETSTSTVTIQTPINPGITNEDADTSDTTVTLSASTNPSANIDTIEWSLGDGTTKTGETISHTYASNGVYSVTLDVTDQTGNTSSTTMDIPANPDCTVIDSNQTLSAGTYEYDCLEVTSGTTVTMEGDPSSDGPDSYGGVKIETVGSITINGTLDASAQGYSYRSGPGSGDVGDGGGYGGAGGGSNAGGTYGSAGSATRLGSGGGSTIGGSGGGAIWLKSSNGTVDISGTVDVSGGGEIYSGGGSGGAIRIEANSLTGTGSLVSSGGDSTDSTGRGGGGGRVLIDGPNTHSYNIDVSDGVGNYDAEPGTVNRQPEISGITTSADVGSVGYETEFIAQFTEPDGDSVSFNWDFGDGTTSTKDEPTHIYSETGTYTVQVTVTDEHGLSNTYSEEYTVEETGSCAVYDSDETLSAGTYEFPCLEVTSGTTVTMEGDPSSDGPDSYGGVKIKTKGDITIDGTLNAAGNGYSTTSGPGSGDVGDGGGYGGAGGGSNAGGTYGSAGSATRLGSGGENGAGGGAVWLESTGGIVDVSGSIKSGGESAGSVSGGGSGGAIRIEAPSITGAGSLDVSGGDSSASSGRGGGGGRIYMNGTDNHSISTDVSRGSASYEGEDGTIVQEDNYSG